MMDDEESIEPRDGDDRSVGQVPEDEPREGIAAQVGAKRPAALAETHNRAEETRPGSPAPPASNRPFTVAAVAVVAIVVAGAALVVLAAGPDIAGPSANRPTPPPAGLPSQGPAAAAPTPMPTADPGVAVKAGFWTLVSAPNASYRLTAKGRSLFDGKTYETFNDWIDVVGDNYSGTIRRTARGPLLNAIQPSQIKAAGIARQDGVVWLKEAGKHRTSRRSNARSDRMTPFLYLDLAAEIDYVKPVTVGGRHLHLLRTNKYYRPDIARLLDLARFNVVPDQMTLDLYVTDAGVPVKATFSVTVSGSDQIGRRHNFRAQTDFTFSSVGAKLAIRVPKG
jgi:hypothetical protein